MSTPPIRYIFEHPDKWKRYRADFSKAVKAATNTGAAPVCPCCEAPGTAVGAWSDDKTKRSCVARGGKELDACLECSFFHNAPEIVAAKKKAQLLLTKMNTPEGEEEECKRIDEEAAAKGIKPLDFIISWE